MAEMKSGAEASTPGRSTSPVATHCRPSGALTHRPVLNSWMGDGAMTSPRTPRQHHPAEVRVGLAQLQRAVEDDRLRVQRQLQSLERRMQEHLTAPTASRERYADLQGSVSGLLEEVGNLVRRVESLDEKMRIRTSSCEESLRQRSRDLEKQLHVQKQQVELAVSTFEETSKRQNAKLRKLEEHARKMSAFEDATRRAQMIPTSPLEAVQARLSELEGQQASLEEEFRHVTASTAVAQAISPRHAAPEEFEAAARLLESELAKLSKQMAAQLDEHSASLTHLRVRTESQEQRLTAADERLEKVVAPSLEALRSEMQQLRSADRAETEQQLEHLARQLKTFAESQEEALLEIRDQAAPEQSATLQELHQMREACAVQEDQMQRLMAYLEQQGLPREELDPSEVLFRVERLENRLDSFNQDGMAEKADRSDVHRLNAALEELQQPLRRLSQRTANNEARTTGLEHQLEQLQAQLATEQGPRTPAHPEAAPSQIAAMSARIVELEEVFSQLATGGNANEAVSPGQLAEVSSRILELAHATSSSGDRTEALEGRVQQLEAASGRRPDSVIASEALSGEVLSQIDDASCMASKALKTAESSATAMQGLKIELVVEQERLVELKEEVQKLSKSFSTELGKVDRLAERQEDQEQRASEAMQKMVASIEKVQGLQAGYEGGTSALNKLLEGIVKRVEATEAALLHEGPPSTSEVHQLRDAIKADLLEQLRGRQDEGSSAGEAVASQEEMSELRKRAESALELAKTSHEMCRTLRAVSIRPESSTSNAHELEELEKELLEKAESSMLNEIKKLDTKVTANVAKINSSAEGLRKDLDDALQRVEASEEASKAVREELMAEDQNEAYTLARTCQNDLRGVHSDVADLQASLRKLASRVEGSVASGTASSKTSLETKVLELQKQVAEELEQLTKHQQVIGKVGGFKGKVDSQELEKSVQTLASQVSQELNELRAHQGELKKVQQLVGREGPPAAVEKSVRELQAKVMAEVEALARQQAELGQTKETMSDLSERVRQAVTMATECKEATTSLEERLKRLGDGSSRVRPEEVRPKTQAPPTVDAPARSPARQADESDDSYADEFEVDDMSVSEKHSR